MSAYAMCVVCKKVIGPLDSTPVTSDCLGRSVNAHDLGWAKINGKWHCREHNSECRTMQLSLWEYIAPPPRKIRDPRFVLSGEFAGMKVYTLEHQRVQP